MKKISLYITSLFLCSVALGQIDRSQYPEPGPAPKINIAEAERFTLPNGLKVFVVENHKLPRVTFSLVLDRDPIFEGDKAGYTSMVGSVLMGGTTTKSKDELDDAIDRIGARLSFSSLGASASSLTKYQDQLLALFSDVLLKPSFPQAELEKVKKQTISGLQAQKDSPDEIASIVSRSVMYGKNHPYGESETEESVANIQIDDVKNYYQQYFRPNIGYLAIVGDITKAKAEELARKYFGAWEKGDVPKHSWDKVQQPAKNLVALVDRPTAVQSVIDITYPVDLPYNSPDRISVSLLNNIFGSSSSSRLFRNLRESKGYTYGAYSSISPDRLIGSVDLGASVRTEVTDSAVYQFMYELKQLKAKNISEEELALAKASATGSFGRSLEQPSTIASFAINSELYDLPEGYYQNYLQNVDAVSVAQVNEMADKYSEPDHAYIVVVGNAAEFKDQLGQFGELKEYNYMGNPVERKEVADANVTAASVVEKYIKAAGGKEKLTSIKSIKWVQEAEAQGMKITTEMLADENRPMAAQVAKMGEMVLSKIIVSKDKAVIEAQGQKQDAPKEVFNAMKAALTIFPELHYGTDGTTITLNGIEAVDGEEAYKVNVKRADGFEATNFYSVASGLKIKSISKAEGEATFKNYTDYEGVKLPALSVVNNPNIPIPLSMETVSVELNPTFSDSDFQ